MLVFLPFRFDLEMGLFQNVVDFYDYNLPYYRFYIYRRFLFEETGPVKAEKKAFSVYENVDYENSIEMVSESMRNGMLIGT
jgi:hypothetical protein